MCGIAGIISKNDKVKDRFDDFIESSKLMNHRGPDFNDFIKHDNLLLIHYRLSIIDLDSRSNQPFSSSSGESVCVYNGEIYNYKELISSLDMNLRTTSDTEVMLESYEKYGEQFIDKWNGIFAMAIHNKKKNNITLIRDRFGVKPLYYYEDDEVILFASEAKVIYNWLEHITISLKGLSEYLWYGNTISSHTIVSNVLKFEQGSLLEIDLNNFKKRESKFWSNPGTKQTKLTETEHILKIKELLGNAVDRQLISDVPLGILLSGGIDSSAIVALAAQKYNSKLDTYSVEYDFNIGGESELKKAALIAKKYNTNHHEMVITSNEVPDIFNSLVFQYDEPFADSANIPLYQLSKACSNDKTVILQGDGGDEIFAGYRRYNIMDWLNFWKYSSSISYKFIKNHRLKERMKRMSFVLNQKDNGLRMAYFLTQNVPYIDPYDIFSNDYKSKLSNQNPFQSYLDLDAKYANEDLVQRLLYADTEILLPHTYLEKVDKATMLTSIESRVPFLDNDLTNYVLSLPSSLKVKNGKKKYLLKKALDGLVPNEILYGKKRGFDVPYKQWLRTNLYDFAHTTFKENTFEEIINTNQLLTLLKEHKQGKVDHGPILWKSLVLSTWLSMYKNKISFS